MTEANDLAADAALVAEAKPRRKWTVDEVLGMLRRQSASIFPAYLRDGHAYHSTAYALDRSVEVIEDLARRLREAERERDELRAALDAMHEFHETGVPPPSLKPAADRETGARRCMVAEPADHCTGGYRAVRAAAELAGEQLTTLRAVAEKRATDADWRRAQRDFA
jgi:hypothetical protein